MSRSCVQLRANVLTKDFWVSVKDVGKTVEINEEGLCSIVSKCLNKQTSGFLSMM